MNELILVSKPKGYTSRDVVNIVSKSLKTKKVGHFGTLDPLAEGLLLIGTNKYTKIGKFLKEDTKEYTAEVLIGTSTNTYDTEGTILKEENINVDKKILEDVLYSFKKTYMQEVPFYSATKVNGKKLYEYARSGEKVSLPKKKVTIYDIKLISLFERENKKYFSFSVKVSKGTYIRSLINDISKELNIPLCMSALLRTKQDKFKLCDANSIEDIKNKTYKYLKLEDFLEVETLNIPEELEKKIVNGSKIDKISNNLVLFKKDNCEVVLYGPYKNEMKPVLTFKK